MNPMGDPSSDDAARGEPPESSDKVDKYILKTTEPTKNPTKKTPFYTSDKKAKVDPEKATEESLKPGREIK